ncbi:MAG: alpha/beta fold hydrolase, partial [Bacteroidota bacterium]
MSLETFKYLHPFSLESGEVLSGFELAYTTYGTWPKNKKGKTSPVIWIFHGLSGSSRLEDWWPWILGKDQIFDPEEYFIICSNNLGSCYGSTNALSLNAVTHRPYFHTFPFLTIRDMVNAADLLREALGIEKIHACIGPSMGGQMALEWSILKPQLIENLFLIASNASHSPWGIAFNEAQRMAIQSDQTWQEAIPEAGMEGMKAARAIALLSYRSYQTFQETQGRPENAGWDNFPAATYQQYQGEKMARRFNAYS